MILRELVDRPDASPQQRTRATTDLALALIGLRRFRDAMNVLNHGRPKPSETDERLAFNYAMAEWGETGTAPRDFLERLIELDRAKTEPPDSANYSQCLAMTFGLLGDREEARKRLGQARQIMMSHPFPEFSAWRYLTVTPPDFMRDLDAISAWLDAKDAIPVFLEKDATEKR
jgi:Flp pilus assembly protein TadD